MRKRLTKHQNRVSEYMLHILNLNIQMIYMTKSTYVLIEYLDNDVQNSTTTKSSEGESSNDDDDSEEEDSLGKVVTKAGREIDRKSAGNTKRSKEEAKADEEPENEFGYTDSELTRSKFLFFFYYSGKR